MGFAKQFANEAVAEWLAWQPFDSQRSALNGRLPRMAAKASRILEGGPPPTCMNHESLVTSHLERPQLIENTSREKTPKPQHAANKNHRKPLKTRLDPVRYPQQKMPLLPLRKSEYPLQLSTFDFQLPLSRIRWPESPAQCRLGFYRLRLRRSQGRVLRPFLNGR